MRLINGECHCRNVRFEFLWPAEDAQIPVRACSCGFCMKHRATYTSHPEAQLTVKISDASLIRKYVFGTRTAEFYVCARCGVLTFAASRIDGREYAVVNVSTFEDVADVTLISRATDFEGETVAQRLARRKRTWTPNVAISPHS